MNNLCEEAKAILEFSDLKSKSKLFNGWWNISDCISDPDMIFVFGDNDIQRGCKGQAVIRYCHNAHGIPTKKVPSYNIISYYTDDEYSDNTKKILDSIEDLIIKVDRDNMIGIYFPEDGLGTGLSMLDTKAPKTLKFLNDIIFEIFAIKY